MFDDTLLNLLQYNTWVQVTLSACSPHVHVSFLSVLQFPSTVLKNAVMWTGYSKLPLGTNVCLVTCNGLAIHRGDFYVSVFLG